MSSGKSVGVATRRFSRREAQRATVAGTAISLAAVVDPRARRDLERGIGLGVERIEEPVVVHEPGQDHLPLARYSATTRRPRRYYVGWVVLTWLTSGRGSRQSPKLL